MKKTNIPSVLIGIPAYNEGANIKKLLSELLKQKFDLFKVVRIIVSCDNCSDDTVKQVKSLKSRLIEVWDNKDRRGQAGRQAEIVAKTNADILVLLNADIIPNDSKFLNELVKPLIEGRADLSSSKIVPSKADNFFESVIHTSVRMKNRVFENYKNGNNLYTCHGTARAFSRKLYTKLKFGQVIAEDAYSYLLAVKNGMKYVYANKSLAFYKLPNNFKDHIRQSSRFYNGQSELPKFFDKNLLSREYGYPKLGMAKSFVKELITHPVLVLAYLGLISFVKFNQMKTKSENFSGIWESVVSTKSPVKNI